METRANYVLIGAFTLAAVVGAFLFIMWISGYGTPGGHKVYQVVFTGSVSGLSDGANVLFNGIKVGEVTHLTFSRSDPHQVVADINVSSDAPIDRSTKARLETQGITGTAAVALLGAGKPGAQLVGENGQPPVIYAEQSMQLQDILDKAALVLDDADRILADNAEPIHSAVTSVDQFSKALANNTAGVDAALRSVGELNDVVATLRQNRGNIDLALKNFGEFSVKINKSADKFGGVLTSAQSLLGAPGTKGALAQFGEAARSVKKLADDVDARVKDIAGGLSRFTGVGLREYEALAIEGRRTINDIDRVVRSLGQNPNQLIFGSKPSLPQYHGGQ